MCVSRWPWIEDKFPTLSSGGLHFKRPFSGQPDTRWVCSLSSLPFAEEQPGSSQNEEDDDEVLTSSWPPIHCAFQSRLGDTLNKPSAAFLCPSQHLRWNWRWAPWIVNADPKWGFNNPCPILLSGCISHPKVGQKAVLKRNPTNGHWQIRRDEKLRGKIQVLNFKK